MRSNRNGAGKALRAHGQEARLIRATTRGAKAHRAVPQCSGSDRRAAGSGRRDRRMRQAAAGRQLRRTARERLRNTRQPLDQASYRAVNQPSMGEGSVELF